MAVQKNNEEVVKTLLEYKANTNLPDKNNKLPLYYAKNNKIKKLLLENGADPNENLYLHQALKTKNKEFFNDLMNTEKINVNLCDFDSKTPIFYCQKADELIKLIKKGADINHTDNYGNSPLHQYYANGNIKLAKQLQKMGANINIANINGYLPPELEEKFKKYNFWIK